MSAHQGNSACRITVDPSDADVLRIEALVVQRGWPDRLTIALEQALFGRTDRTAYGREAAVSPATATGDLRRAGGAQPERALSSDHRAARSSRSVSRRRR